MGCAVIIRRAPQSIPSQAEARTRTTRWAPHRQEEESPGYPAPNSAIGAARATLTGLDVHDVHLSSRPRDLGTNVHACVRVKLSSSPPPRPRDRLHPTRTPPDSATWGARSYHLHSVRGHERTRIRTRIGHRAEPQPTPRNKNAERKKNK
ncbi:hypothetical protein B0H16DRAFT_1737051 [Mycena metata]|uniref:Uncharacterized protein n=1 Tax=Mycena metata TaxID=1033252 RepID=A0AAD7HLY0_9AGAR|nr:hypothetical protein B0H16DRAFT_1737051 [Mycena metata]